MSKGKAMIEKEIEEDIWQVTRNLYNIEHKAYGINDKVLARKLEKVRWTLVKIIGGEI